MLLAGCWFTLLVNIESVAAENAALAMFVYTEKDPHKEKHKWNQSG